MNVRELIEQLQKVDDKEIPVRIQIDSWDYEITHNEGIDMSNLFDREFILYSTFEKETGYPDDV